MRRTRLAILASWLAWSVLGAGLVAWGPIQRARRQSAADGGYGAGRAAANAAFGAPAIAWFVGLAFLLGWSALSMGRDTTRAVAVAERDRLRREREPFPGFSGVLMALCAAVFVAMGTGLVGEEVVLASAGAKAPARYLGDAHARGNLCRYEWRLAGETREILGPCPPNGATVDYLPALPWIARVSGGSAWAKVGLGLVTLTLGLPMLGLGVDEIRQARTKAGRR